MKFKSKEIRAIKTLLKEVLTHPSYSVDGVKYGLGRDAVIISRYKYAGLIAASYALRGYRPE